jgi:O-antigen ligase
MHSATFGTTWFTPQRIWWGGLVMFVLCLLAALVTDQWLLLGLPFVAGLAVLYTHDVRLGFFALAACIPWSFNLEEQLGIGVDFPDEPLMLLLTITALFWVCTQAKNIPWRKLLHNPIVILIVVAWLWTLITVIYSENPALSFKFLIKKVWYLVPFFVWPLFIFQQRQNIRQTALAVLLPLLAVVLFITYRFSAYGFRFEAVHNPLQPFFMNHVMYGSMVSIMVPVAVGALFLSRLFSWRWFLSGAAFLILLMATYLAYSRASWAAIVFALGAVVLVRFRVMHWAMLLFYAVLLSGVLYLSQQNRFLNYKPKFEKTIMHESLEDHIMATLQGTDISSAERYFRWIAAVRMSADRPIAGVGPNNFYDYYKAYVVNSFKTWVSRNPEKSTTHNYFLYMLVEQGYPALCLYAALMVWLFFYAQKVYRRANREGRIMVLTAVGVIAATFINNFFSELLEADKVGSLFYMAIATLIAIDVSSTETPLHEPTATP